MWRRKKFIIIAVVVATVVLVGSTVGVVYAQTNSTDNTTPGKTLLARVAAILGIDEQRVEDAFVQARTEMRDEALGNYLKGLVSQGKITQAQADEFMKWWQSRPDMSQYQQQLREWQQARPNIPSEFSEWQEARPDIPLPGGFGGRMGRLGAVRSFWCR